LESGEGGAKNRVNGGMAADSRGYTLIKTNAGLRFLNLYSALWKLQKTQPPHWKSRASVASYLYQGNTTKVTDAFVHSG
jgi:hypothetical protein